MTKRVGLAAVSLALAGCSLLAPRPDPSRFYTLTPLAETEADASDAPLRGVVLGLGPVELPAYLDRPELVTRVEPNRLAYSDVARWAGPVRASVAQVLARNLMLLLGADQVVAFPWFGAVQAKYVVEVRVTQFERGPDGSAELAAVWVLRDGQRRGRLDGGEARLREGASAPTDEAAVAAQSRALGTFARALAAAIRRAEVGRGAQQGGA